MGILNVTGKNEHEKILGLDENSTKADYFQSVKEYDLLFHEDGNPKQFEAHKNMYKIITRSKNNVKAKYTKRK